MILWIGVKSKIEVDAPITWLMIWYRWVLIMTWSKEVMTRLEESLVHKHTFQIYAIKDDSFTILVLPLSSGPSIAICNTCMKGGWLFNAPHSNHSPPNAGPCIPWLGKGGSHFRLLFFPAPTHFLIPATGFQTRETKENVFCNSILGFIWNDQEMGQLIKRKKYYRFSLFEQLEDNKCMTWKVY